MNTRQLMHEDDLVLYFSTRDEAHGAILRANAHAKTLVAEADEPKRYRIVVGEDRDDVSVKQRRFLHGPVLGQIVEQAKADGQRFVMAVWKEYYRAKFLGFRWEHYKLPGQKKATPRKVRVSTEDLSIKQYSEYIDKVLADAATEFGVVFDLDPAEREAVRYVRPVRAKKQAEAVPA